MFSLVRRLHQRSESYRKRFSFLISLFITLALIGVWISVAGIRFSGELAIKEEVEIQEIASPFSTFKDDFTSLKERISEGFGNILNSFGTIEYSASDISK